MPTMDQRDFIAKKTRTSSSFVGRVATRVLCDNEIGPRPRGGAHNVKITDDVGAFIWALWEQDVQLNDYEYQQALRGIGVDVDRSTINRYLNNVLQLPVKKPYEIRLGKYTDENMLYLVDYLEMIKSIHPMRLRFFDQMGCDSRATGRHRCRFPRGVPAHVGAPASRGTHISVSGITSIRPEQPALYYEGADGPHTAEHHAEWMLEMATDNIIVRGDVTVSDNWSGHVGEVGQRLERELAQDYGITFIPLPRYSPELNPIELTWGTVKMWMRDFPRGSIDDTLHALQTCLGRVTHPLIFSEYRHRFYI